MNRVELADIKVGYDLEAGGYPGFGMVDLQDFNDPKLDEVGELEIPRRAFRHGEVTLELGHKLGEDNATILNVAYHTFEDTSSDCGTSLENRSALGFYSLHNTDNGHAIYLDDSHLTTQGELVLNGNTADGNRYHTNVRLIGGQAIVLGSAENDQGLHMGEQVDNDHVVIRIGNIGRNFHIMDLITRGGTRVYIPKEAYGEVMGGCRYFKISPSDDKLTHEAIHGRWSRPGIGKLAN